MKGLCVTIDGYKTKLIKYYTIMKVELESRDFDNTVLTELTSSSSHEFDQATLLLKAESPELWTCQTNWMFRNDLAYQRNNHEKILNLIIAIWFLKWCVHVLYTMWQDKFE